MADHYPTKQVIVMRTDLGMRKGKMVAQGAHASMAFLSRQVGSRNYRPIEVSDVEREWMLSSFAKVCVGVPGKEELCYVMARADELGLKCYEIIDNGTTEFGGVPTLTCCAIGPDYSEKINLVTGGLKLL